MYVNLNSFSTLILQLTDNLKNLFKIFKLLGCLHSSYTNGKIYGILKSLLFQMIMSPHCVEKREFFYYTNNSNLKKTNRKNFVVDLFACVEYVPCKTRLY